MSGLIYFRVIIISLTLISVGCKGAFIFEVGLLNTIFWTNATVIIHMKDIQANGNCKFRAIADMLGFGEDGWPQVRCDLLTEMHVYAQLYESVYGSAQHLEEIRHLLNHFEGGASYDYWTVMPEIGYLISSHYNVVLLLLPMHQSLTFLPLRTEPIPHVAC